MTNCGRCRNTRRCYSSTSISLLVAALTTKTQRSPGTQRLILRVPGDSTEGAGGGIMRVVDQGIAVKAEPNTDRSSCAFASIAVLPGGRWICGFRAAPKKKENDGQQAMLAWSDDEGLTWCMPFSPWTPPMLDGKPGLFRAANLTALANSRVLATLYWVDHSDPSLPFFNEETEGLLDSRLFFSFSADDGESWSEPRLLDTTPFHQPTPTTGPTLLLPNGEWALQFELNKHYYDRQPGSMRRSCCSRRMRVFHSRNMRWWLPTRSIVSSGGISVPQCWQTAPCLTCSGLMMQSSPSI